MGFASQNVERSQTTRHSTAEVHVGQFSHGRRIGIDTELGAELAERDHDTIEGAVGIVYLPKYRTMAGAVGTVEVCGFDSELNVCGGESRSCLVS